MGVCGTTLANTGSQAHLHRGADAALTGPSRLAGRSKLIRGGFVMTALELLTAVGLPAYTDVSHLDLALVDTLRDAVGYMSAGRTPEAQALALLDARLRRPNTEGYLFEAEGEEFVLVIADAEAILDITPVSRTTLMRDLRHHMHYVQGVLRQLQGTPRRSSLRHR